MAAARQSPKSKLFRSHQSSPVAGRRGELKISDPIPITREQAAELRNQGFPFLHTASSRSLRQTSQSTEEAAGGGVDVAAHVRVMSAQSTLSTTTAPHSLLQRKRLVHSFRDPGTSTIKEHSPPGRHKPMSSLVSPLNSSSTSYPSKAEMDGRRKNSGIKTVLKKIFGRQRAISDRSDIHHRSVPINFITSPTSTNSQRSKSFPLGEMTDSDTQTSRPLPRFAHGLRPEEGDAPKSPASPFDQTPGKPRRATIPSVVLAPHDSENVAENVRKTLSRLGFQQDGEPEDPTSIGYAITDSGSNPKRRSRSADALRELAKQQQSLSADACRRKSEDLQYWGGSVLEDDSIRLQAKSDLSRRTSDVLPIEGRENMHEQGPDGGQSTFHDQTPSFDFGPTVRSFGDLGAASIEDRVTTLEVKLADLERAISRIQTLMPHNAATHSNTNRHSHTTTRNFSRTSIDSIVASPKSKVPSYNFDEQLAAATQQQQQQRPTVKRYSSTSDLAKAAKAARFPSTFLSSPGTSPTSMYMRVNSISSTSQDDRYRPMTSRQGRAFQSTNSASSADVMTTTMEHYASLLSLIQREQSARRNMETQLTRLQQEVEMLRSQPMGGFYLKDRGYPTPNSEHHIGGLAPPAMEVSVFDATEDSGSSFRNSYRTESTQETQETQEKEEMEDERKESEEEEDDEDEEEEEEDDDNDDDGDESQRRQRFHEMDMAIPMI